MTKLLRILVAALTLGSQPQSFLGARWVGGLLRICPPRWRGGLALRLLALSPHYFFRDLKPEYRRMPARQFMAAEAERNESSRRLICEQILAPWLEPSMTVLDLGCGPGYLARQVAARVRRVWAGDISRGVLACARALNGADNIEYFLATPEGYRAIPDGSVDFLYSFAVVQHLTDDTLRAVLAQVRPKLRHGARALLHVVLERSDWRTEQDWRQTTRWRVGSSSATGCTASCAASRPCARPYPARALRWRASGWPARSLRSSATTSPTSTSWRSATRRRLKVIAIS